LANYVHNDLIFVFEQYPLLKINTRIYWSFLKNLKVHYWFFSTTLILSILYLLREDYHRIFCVCQGLNSVTVAA